MSKQQPDISKRLLWRAASSVHNWRDRALPYQLIKAAVAHGLVGATDWIEVGIRAGGRRATRVEPDDLALELFRLAPQAADQIAVSAGGTEPRYWDLHVRLEPFDPETKQVEGYSMINLEFDMPAEVDAAYSADLIEMFKGVHSPGNTEFACIHPYVRLLQLAAVGYAPPLVFAPMLAGIYWANFLGPGHLDKFDAERLRGLSAYLVEFVGDEGLLLVVSPRVDEATTEQVEREMQRLTDEFRRALK
ncbi:MAG TPA: hypothetical protein VFS10_19875 [Pyrinomonadaceae bacterium]|nr:hypothetical protein [Pyrinomonadaceae bacterium]